MIDTNKIINRILGIQTVKKKVKQFSRSVRKKLKQNYVWKETEIFFSVPRLINTKYDGGWFLKITKENINNIVNYINLLGINSNIEKYDLLKYLGSYVLIVSGIATDDDVNYKIIMFKKYKDDLITVEDFLKIKNSYVFYNNKICSGNVFVSKFLGDIKND